MGLITRVQDYFFPKLPLIPPVFDEDGWFVCFDGSRKHRTMRMDNEEFTFRCIYSASHPFTGKGKASPSRPPEHWHRYQTEWFTILDGSLGYLVNGVEHKAKKGDVVTLQPGNVHSFWCDPKDGEDLTIDITLRPGKGLDEEWVYSVYGYFESAFVQGKGLSFLQLMVFWDEAEGVPGTVPKWIGRFLVWTFGKHVGRWAGYKGTYQLYADAAKAQRAPSGKATPV
ncbi:hypothetical protein EXIGLDRAFT_838244 [Exidia glandulosa HHB12029]|uniref:Cupin type-2 domain-containing protein n=1 Tax=Exidia glandulosa HHB12029 TaxID=1314781 RepID=A0A165G1V9_EXIGL|nr:hypothetical protein EXIGLDRAFT_838244 [Exidia glandulosa HHB12029]